MQSEKFYSKIYDDPSYCGGHDQFKENIIKKLLAKHGSNFKNHLDIGASRGRFLATIAAENRYAFEMADSPREDLLKENVHIIGRNIETEEIEQRPYDLISALDVIEHLFDPLSACIKARGALSKGGIFIVSVPNDILNLKTLLPMLLGKKDGAIFQFSDNGHIRFFSSKSLFNILKMAGFSSIEVHCYGKHNFLNAFLKDFTAYGFIGIGKA